jgi:hypothetical protein
VAELSGKHQNKRIFVDNKRLKMPMVAEED